jgi:hypothetical protein
MLTWIRPIFSISCQDTDLTFLSQNNHLISSFPCTYLGLSLHIRKIPKAALLSLIRKIANKLPEWTRGFMTYPGREVLVKLVLSSMPTYFLIVFKMPKWTFKQIDHFRRSFLWRGQDPENVRGGHCLINWQTCLRPKKLGEG